MAHMLMNACLDPTKRLLQYLEIAVDLRHLRCAAGALAQRVNRVSGWSPNTPTRDSLQWKAVPTKGEAHRAERWQLQRRS